MKKNVLIKTSKFFKKILLVLCSILPISVFAQITIFSEDFEVSSNSHTSDNTLSGLNESTWYWDELTGSAQISYGIFSEYCIGGANSTSKSIVLGQSGAGVGGSRLYANIPLNSYVSGYEIELKFYALSYGEEDHTSTSSSKGTYDVLNFPIKNNSTGNFVYFNVHNYTNAISPTTSCMP